MASARFLLPVSCRQNLKRQKTIFVIFVLLGCLFWLVDSWLDYAIFYGPQLGFLELLILDVPSHEVWVRLSSLVLFTLFGLVASLLTSRIMSRDQRLKEDRRYYRTIIDSLHEGILVLDTDYRIVDANRLALEELGMPIEKVRGKLCHRLICGDQDKPCDTPDHPCGVPELLRTGRPQNCHHIHRLPEGGVQHVDVLFSPIVDGDGNVTRILRAARDVTDLFEAQEQVERLARFPAENPEPVMRLDQHCRLIYANDASKPILDLWKRGVGDTLADPAQAVCREVLQSGKTSRLPVQVDGESFLLNFVPVIDGQYVNIYAHNITQEQKLQDRLHQARRMEAIGRLAGGVAHDFNNMLTPILGYAEILSMELQGRRKEDADQIINAAYRSRELVSQLLSLGRKQMLHPQSLDLSSTVRGMEDMLKRLVPENIDLLIHTGDRVCGVKADPTHIQQILINLVVNAVEAMPNGGKLTVETTTVHLDESYCDQHEDVQPGSYCLLSVTDNGKGMSREVVQQVFEPFFTTKHENQVGSGLGLATVHGIVKQHKGHINVYSELDQGTCFKIYLPQEDVVQEPETEEPETRALPRGNETLLVVEDDELVAKLAQAALVELGYEVLLTQSPEEALSTARDHGNGLDLLLTDVVLPSCNGRRLHERLLSDYPNLPVLYMSGYTGNVIQHHGVLEEGIKFLAKPFTLHELALGVREALDARPSRSPA